MRDPKRIRKFCNELADVWELVPDWRFGQLVCNVFGELGMDPFFPEDDKMMEHFKNYFNIQDGGE